MPLKTTRIARRQMPAGCLCLLLFVLSPVSSYAAPCYGVRMPEKNKFFAGIQDYNIFKRYQEHNQGKLRSLQNFLLLSYGLFDWLSLDLKGGAGYVKQHPPGRDEIDYPTYLGGGYGFRLRLLNQERIKAVFGFQHISIHPETVVVDNQKNKAVLDDWQFSLLGSYGFKIVTPYLGIRWSRVDYIHWKDGARNRVKSERGKDIGLIAGLDLMLSRNTWVNLEASFFDSEALAVSLNYSF